ncbi:hypothetical protein AB6D87_11720 [Vibrio lentus]
MKNFYRSKFFLNNVVDNNRPFIHRFYDTSPISPSGKYIALFELPYEDRTPSPGDTGFVVVIELTTRNIIYRSETAAWDTQLGAQVQWGRKDDELYFNRLNGTSIYGVVVNLFKNKEESLPQPIYMISPNGKYAVSTCLKRISNVQKGYGVVLNKSDTPTNLGASNLDGVIITDLISKEWRMVLSYQDIYEKLIEKFHDLDMDKGGFYGFHTKWNPKFDRIMLVLRWLPVNSSKTKNYLITFNSDGGDIKMLVDADRWVGGHHPNWCPDGENIIMNLMFPNPKFNFGKAELLFEKFFRKLKLRFHSNHKHLKLSIINDFDGTISTFNNNVFGSGHPVMCDGYVITDAYPNERVALRNGDVPLRLIGPSSCEVIAFLHTKPKYSNKVEWRIDPHPSIDRTGTKLVFNARSGDFRGVYIMDIENVNV